MFFFNKPIIAGCGHLTRRVSSVSILGKIEKIKLNKGVNSPLYCPECLAKMAARCIKCGRVILPGDPITLYRPEEIGCCYSDNARVFMDENNISVVGCVSEGCSEFARCIGYWAAPGQVQFLKTIKNSEEFICLA